MTTQPIAPGIVGFAVGAVLASIVSPTNLERHALEDYADTAKRRATETASTLLDGLSDVVAKAKDAALEQFAEEGIGFLKDAMLGDLNAQKRG